MSNDDRRDLVRFLLELGRPDGEFGDHDHAALAHPCRVPVRSGAACPRAMAVLEAARSTVNVSMIFMPRRPSTSSKQKGPLPLLPQFPGLDGGVAGPLGQPE